LPSSVSWSLGEFGLVGLEGGDFVGQLLAGFDADREVGVPGSVVADVDGGDEAPFVQVEAFLVAVPAVLDADRDLAAQGRDSSSEGSDFLGFGSFGLGCRHFLDRFLGGCDFGLGFLDDLAGLGQLFLVRCLGLACDDGQDIVDVEVALDREE
jgi:hypothetical protein